MSASERRRDRGEGLGKARADGGDGGNDHHRDERGDQAVLDRGRTAFVAQDTRKNCQHAVAPMKKLPEPVRDRVGQSR